MIRNPPATGTPTCVTAIQLTGFSYLKGTPGGILIQGPLRTSYASGSNPGEDMDVCKCIVPSQHGGTLNSRRAASPLVRLVEGGERWEAPDPPPGCSPSKLGWN
ncbi:uncharacterized protein TNCV_1540001 [Trichonephila clavipes]|nr:uncharacterized protein TNCV_1540001 [Trichonephila clavipes]